RSATSTPPPALKAASRSSSFFIILGGKGLGAFVPLLVAALFFTASSPDLCLRRFPHCISMVSRALQLYYGDSEAGQWDSRTGVEKDKSDSAQLRFSANPSASVSPVQVTP